MQQTEKYKLNLIEPTDPFLPDALNQNTQKMENAMIAHEENIEDRLTVLEAFKFAYGTFAGTYNPSSANDTPQFIPLPFKPMAVYVDAARTGTTNYSAFSIRATGGQNPYLKLLDNGFQVSAYPNNTGLQHNYIAFG